MTSSRLVEDSTGITHWNPEQGIFRHAAPERIRMLVVKMNLWRFLLAYVRTLSGQTREVLMTYLSKSCAGVQGFKYRAGDLEAELIATDSNFLRLTLFWSGKNGVACHADDNSLQFDGYAERALELGEVLIQVGQSLKELAQEWPRRDVQPAETISW